MIKLVELLTELIDIYSPDELDSKNIEYGAAGSVRTKLYDYYLKKHFSDFENIQEKYGDVILHVWKKI